MPTNLAAGTLSAARATGSTGPMQGPQDPYIRISSAFRIGGPDHQGQDVLLLQRRDGSVRHHSDAIATVPTAAFKTGVFNYFDDLDLTPRRCDITGPAYSPTIQFGDDVSLDRSADPTMQKIFALYPNPTFDNGDGFTGTSVLSQHSAQNSYYQTVAKIDHHFTDRETLSVRYGYDDFCRSQPGPRRYPSRQYRRLRRKVIGPGTLANLTSTLSSNLINYFTFGWNNIYANFNCTGLDVLDSVCRVDRFGNGWDFNMDPVHQFWLLQRWSPMASTARPGPPATPTALAGSMGTTPSSSAETFAMSARTGPNSSSPAARSASIRNLNTSAV